ncbi:glycoside hydrolase family 97 protein [Bacteroides sp. UBA939]|uniref:glycoside hydrolase family 97 protein n=1 Tax=Bacteroides sp. UBA939 TaxID=1946092 RepID=UPI0025C6D654|nr:glycoside hydrolase family 97 protein [Bacteroides sp. UBA939]
MKNTVTTIIICLFLTFTGAIHAQQYKLASPDGRLNITVQAGETLNWKIVHEETTVLLPSAIAMQWQNEKSTKQTETLGKNIKVTRSEHKRVNTSFETPIYKKASVEDVYNRLTLRFREGFGIEFRAYNDGAAYRFISERRDNILVKAETAEFNFAKNHKAWVPYINDMRSGERYTYSFESYYDEIPLSQMVTDSLAITPLLVELDGGKKAVIMEAGLEDYPGMFLVVNPQSRQGLQAEFAPYPLEEVIGGHNRLNLIPTRRADYIARTTGRRTFPWRVVLVSEQDAQLADNDMAQRLAAPSRIRDISWIKPGKVAWDWWNTTNLTGVDFKAGMNTPTYKAFIDFAGANGLEYIIIDDGWSDKETLMKVIPEIDLKELIAYGKEKNVDIILWASWRLTEKEKEVAFSHYSAMGIKGFKVDFFDRDDQPIVKSMYDIAECAARYQLLLDYHGMKSFGLHRPYPNVVNFEGVKGLENSKWEPVVNGAPLHNQPRYDVAVAYLRMLAGPLDYTPGAMVNATRSTFRAINDHPMSQGTRVHQMAMYALYEAPLQMLADSPSKYMKEQECTDFIAKVPTTFDETRALAGKLGEYIVIARRKGDVWYISALTDWTSRTCSLDLSFLDANSVYQANIFSDGINADVEATDYRREVRNVKASDKLNIQMAPGGGWTARLVKQ